MATTHHLPHFEDHPGARWLAPMALAMLIVTAMIVAVMIYPFVTA